MKKIILLLLFIPLFALGQVYEWTDENSHTHRIMMDNEYLVETIFETQDGKFVSARGGYYAKKEGRFNVAFEFNANLAKDSLKAITLDPTSWEKVAATNADFDGKFLMAGRVKTEGEQRRDLNRSRKTMKFLQDGYFQWIAFDTNGLHFIASGGGTYTASEGAYIETIGFFSRDHSRVGKVLPFTYTLEGNDWYHQGKSSQGKPMHEIWTRRKSKFNTH